MSDPTVIVIIRDGEHVVYEENFGSLEDGLNAAEEQIESTSTAGS